MRKLLVVTMVIAASVPLVAVPATAASRAPTVAVSAESLRYDANGTERYLHVLAERSGRTTTVLVDGYVAGQRTCADGSTVDAFTLITGGGSGVLDVAGSLEHATAHARVDLTVEVLAGCPGSGGTVVRRARPVALTVAATGPALRVLTSSRVRVPASTNTLHIERQTIRSAAGDMTVGARRLATTSASIERDHTVSRGADTEVSFLAGLATVDHERSVIRQARGARYEQAQETPPVGGVFGRFVDVIAETVDRTDTTVYAATGIDRIIRCADGGLGVRTVQRYGSAAGTLTIGPRFRSANADARAVMTKLVLNGCTGNVVERALGPTDLALDLQAEGPVLTATDFRVFSTAHARGHERVTIVGRDGVTGTVRIGSLTVAPTEGGIGKRSAHTHRTGTGS